MQSGVMCKSISEVNAMVDARQVGQSYKNNNKNSTQSTLHPSLSFADRNTNHNNLEPTKQNDTVMRVWLAPYQDHDDNYNSQGFVYTPVKKGGWIINQKDKN